MVCDELDIRLGSIGADVHRVGADTVQACREAKVEYLEVNNLDIFDRGAWHRHLGCNYFKNGKGGGGGEFENEKESML